MSSQQKPLRVLILSRHPDMQGGVVRFLELMKQRLAAGTQAESFIIGRRPGERNVAGTAVRVVTDMIGIFIRVVRRRYDVVHLNPSLEPKSVVREGALMAVLLLAGQRRIFVFFHGWDPDLADRIARNALFRKVFCALFQRASRIAVLSDRFRRSLVEMGFEAARIDIVSTMFDGAELTRARAEDDRAKQRWTTLFMSRFVAAKGVYELIDGFARIAAEFPDARLTLAGDGEERTGMGRRVQERGLGERVTFPGYVMGRDKARLLLEADIFALPSYYNEGLPNALLEAMAAGAAVITSEAGGIPEVVHAPKNGFILKDITADTIAAALTELLANPSRVAMIGAENESLAWQRFESLKVTGRIESLYGNVAAEAHPA